MMLFGALVIGVLGLPPAAASDRLGAVVFPTSCSSAVQPTIERGVALLHSFQYEEAAQEFDNAAHRDASCAMCHWGKAMTLVRLGMWEETIALNLRAAASGAHAAMEHRGDRTYQIHAMDYLRYAYLQRGMESKARALNDELSDVPAASDNEKMADRAYFAGRTAIELHRWSEAAALPIPNLPLSWLSDAFWARAIGAARSGDVGSARENLVRLRESVRALQAGREAGSKLAREVPITQLEAEAWVAFAEGNSDQALNYLRRAADREAADGGESVAVPAREMLADLLLEIKRPAESLSAYQSVLKAAPNRFDALLGAARAADALGGAAQVRDYYRQLIAVAAADADRPEIETARAYLRK